MQVVSRLSGTSFGIFSYAINASASDEFTQSDSPGVTVVPPTQYASSVYASYFTNTAFRDANAQHSGSSVSSVMGSASTSFTTTGG